MDGQNYKMLPGKNEKKMKNSEQKKLWKKIGFSDKNVLVVLTESDELF